MQAIALRLKAKKACPLITSHIKGKKNDIADVPSRHSAATRSGIVKLTLNFYLFLIIIYITTIEYSK